MRFRSNLLQIFASILVLAIGTTACAQNLEGAALVHALERGGLCTCMRHASSQQFADGAIWPCAGFLASH
jgi:hypothetical protein